ncbi:DENN domain-containing protein 3 isoform X1 [Patella vulgata]|uniref:DENN domain-containing protein 3 isoform X1 n=2 Tax=Patella vulgata TaxID=6465 RepID=UPI0021803EAA|nr:DENN domain-containing protein 3 isoform X1 [Patella vulgata]
MASASAILKNGSVYNGLVDIMLVLGIDENTGLRPVDEIEKFTTKEIFDNLYYQDFEAPVLAAITGNKAYYFQPTLWEDPHYPPAPDDLHSADVKHFQYRPRSYSLGSKIKKRSGVSRTVSSQLGHQRRLSNKRTLPLPAPDLPVSEEMLNSITTFCFPDNARAYRQKPENVVHFLVFTDITGKKTFATCITFYKPMIIWQDTEFNIHVDLDTSGNRGEKSDLVCYLPQCCVLISKHPYYYSLKECLSCLVDHIERDVEEMYSFIKDFTYILCLTPVPPSGNVQIEFMLFNLPITLPPSEWPDKPVINVPLHLVFLIFSVEDVLKIITAMLTEEKLTFVSSSYALLTVVMESFLYFILPFNWRYSYVPIITDSSLDFLEAVGAFMMGCHSKHLSVVKQINDIVVVNIDDGTVSINQSDHNSDSYLTSDTNCSRLPSMPKHSVNLFKHHFTRNKYQRDLADVSRPFPLKFEEEKNHNMKQIQIFNGEISFACLELMVNLFRGVIGELKIDVRHFNKVGFLETVSEESRPFYEKILPTSIFRAFLEDRLNEKQDYWSELELKSRPVAKRMSLTGDRFQLTTKSRKPLNRHVSVSCFSVFNRQEFETFYLPSLTTVNMYVRKCIESISCRIESSRDYTARCSYRYLRAMFRAAAGNYVQALEDLFNLPTGFTSLQPKDLIRGMIDVLGEKDKEELYKQKGYKQQLERLLNEDETVKRLPIKLDKECPDHDLYLDEFLDIVSLHDMSTDYDISTTLFDALKTINYVDQYTYEVFDLCYMENQKNCLTCLASLTDDVLGTDENILQISPLIKTDYGTGRVGLTDKRLFFLKDGSNAFKELIRLHRIARLEKTQLHSFLKAVDALTIQNEDGSIKFSIWLKADRNCWFLLIQEMMCGRRVAIATKDHSVTHQAAQNVLLIDAVVKSGLFEQTAHYNRINDSAESLCFYSRYVAEERHILPSNTLSALQKRVDPCQGERQRTTVEALLYTPGFNTDEEEIPPRLWCGMGDKKIRIFDASTFLLEANHITTKNNVITFASVGEEQVWAGALGIYIIDTKTMTTSKTLTDHKDLVSSIYLTDDKRYAFSASLDGVIIKWEIPSLKTLQVLHLEDKLCLRSLKLADDKLWCGTWEGIHVFNETGSWLTKLDFQSIPIKDSKTQEIECFEITPNELWAGLRRKGMILIWDRESKELKTTIRLGARGISTLVLSNDKMWVGTKQGEIHIYRAKEHKLWKKLTAHHDAIRSMCRAEDRYILSGACSKDGKVAIWSQTLSVDSGSYENTQL